MRVTRRLTIATCFLLAALSATAATFTPLGFIPLGSDGKSFARGVSADGSVVVGYGTPRREAYRWTANDGIVGLGWLTPYGSSSFATAVSVDGSSVVGTSVSARSARGEAFLWSTNLGLRGIGFLPGGTESGASGVSAYGSVVVGAGSYSSAPGVQYEREAFRWTAAGGMVGLGFLPGGLSSVATGVSSDGSVVVGHGPSTTGGGYGAEPFRWTANEGIVGLGILSGQNFAAATGVSSDGAVVVGYAYSTTSDVYSQQAFRWTASGGMVGLGVLPRGGVVSAANAASADGSVVVGYSDTASEPEAFLWTADGGMQSLFDVLLAGGATGLTNWQLTNAHAISADGNFIVGEGIDPQGRTQAFEASFVPATAVPLPATVWFLGTGIAGLLLRSRRNALG
jgi:probable HAF family extracellular repeat protein